MAVTQVRGDAFHGSHGVNVHWEGGAKPAIYDCRVTVTAVAGGTCVLRHSTNNYFTFPAITRRNAMSALIALRCGHSLPSCCPLSNAFEAATRAYRHLVNGTIRKRDGRTDRQTDRQIAALLYDFDCRHSATDERCRSTVQAGNVV